MLLGGHPLFLRMLTARALDCLQWQTKMGSALTAGRPGTDWRQLECVLVPFAALQMDARQPPPAVHRGIHRSKSHVPGLEPPIPLVEIACWQSVQHRT